MTQTRAFDLAQFVPPVPANPGDGAVVSVVGPPFQTQFSPVVVGSKPGVVVGSSVPAANALGQTLVSGAGPGFAWQLVASPTGGGGVVTSFNTRINDVVLAAGDVAGAGGALLASPAFTGAPTAPTAAPGTSTTQLATTAFAAGVLSAAGSSTLPVMDGTAAIGAGATFARADHVHPTDTSRYAASNPAGYQTSAQVTAALVAYAPLASPAFTGNPTAPTPAPGDSDTSVATTAFVATAIAGSVSGVASFNTRTGAVTLSNADVTAALPSSAVMPVVDGSSTPGVSTAWSRGDHVHPTDTSRYAASNPSGYQTAGQVAAATVNSIDFSPTGLTPGPGATGAVTVGGMLTVPFGGTGKVTNVLNGVLIGNGANAIKATAAGPLGGLMIGAGAAVPTWLAVGATDNVLSVASGTPAWKASTGTGNAVLSDSPSFTTTATFGGSVTVSGALNAAAAVNLTAASGTGRAISYYTGASARWIFMTNGTAEGGTATGSDFQVNAFDNTAAYLGTPFFIYRANGVIEQRAYGAGGYSGAGAAGDANLVINKAGSTHVTAIRGASNGLFRWAITLADPIAEGGSNAGSNFGITSYTDAGANLATPLSIARSTGVVTFSQPIVNGSDKRLKSNVEPVKDALAIVGALAGVFYQHAGAGKRQVGLIAQDVAPVLPEVVFECPVAPGDPLASQFSEADPMLGISYPNIVAVLVEAVKELDALVGSLRAELLGRS